MTATFLAAMGAESYASTTTAQTDPDGQSVPGTGASVTRDTTVKNSRGRASFACNSGASNGIVSVKKSFASTNALVGKASFCFTSFPATETAVLEFDSVAQVTVDSSGAIRVYDGSVVGSQLGPFSGLLVADGATFYSFEFYARLTAGANGYRVAFRLNTSLLGDTGSYNSGGPTVNATLVSVGWDQAPGASKIVNVDDVVVYGDTDGASPAGPTWAYGDARVLLCVPLSDGAVTGFTDGGGGTTNLFGALDNLPPAGVASGSAANGTQIKDSNKNTTDNYTANLQTPTAAGVLASDTIQAAIAIAWGGNSSTTSLTGTYVATNPSTSFSIVPPAAAAGTWPSNWKSASSVVSSPSVTLGTAPTIKITKGTSSNNGLFACQMGMTYVVTPPPATPTLTYDQDKIGGALQAVKRAAFFMQAWRGGDPCCWRRRRRSGLLVPGVV